MEQIGFPMMASILSSIIGLQGTGSAALSRLCDPQGEMSGLSLKCMFSMELTQLELFSLNAALMQTDVTKDSEP